MKYIQFPDNFFKLAEPLSNFKESRAVILPVPYEKTTTGIKGTSRGPDAIRNASGHVQLYDEELHKSPCEAGICTLEAVEQQKKDRIMDAIQDRIKKILDHKKFPVMVGGEHSITYGAVAACKEFHADFSVLQLDAHADLIDIYDNTRHSHACAGRRCYEITKNIVQVGIRSVFEEEVDFIQKNNIPTFWAKDIVEDENWHTDAISKLKSKVYITVDLDGFDPSLIPHVGTPEPGGLLYYPTLRFLRKVFQKKDVIGCDIVELCPRKNNISFVSDFTAAKLLYKLIGYKFL